MIWALVAFGAIALVCFLVWFLPDPFDYDPPRCHCCGQPLEY